MSLNASTYQDIVESNNDIKEKTKNILSQSSQAQVPNQARAIENNLTEFSGIRAENLTNAVCFEQMRAQLLVVMNSETILVGHHLSNDLKVLKLVHPKIVDTAVMFRTSEGRFRSLKALAQFHLGKRIHDGLDGHDSAEDATICLELVAKRYPELVQNWST